MTLAQLITQFRIQAKDAIEPYFWSDDMVTTWLNEAQAEAAIRARLIYEASEAEVCEVAVTSGTDSYALSAYLFEIAYQAFLPTDGKKRILLRLVSVEWLDRHHPHWREETGMPRWMMQTDNAVRLAPEPDTDGTLYLEGYRLPLADLAEDTDTPEINAAHHRHLIDWALFRAFSIPDTESFDAQRGQQAQAAFADYFGLAPDADLRRASRMDEPQCNEAFFV